MRRATLCATRVSVTTRLSRGSRTELRYVVSAVCRYGNRGIVDAWCRLCSVASEPNGKSDCCPVACRGTLCRNRHYHISRSDTLEAQAVATTSLHGLRYESYI